MKLKLFENGWDTYVAYDTEHVVRLCEELTSYKSDSDEWWEVDENHIVLIRFQDISDVLGDTSFSIPRLATWDRSDESIMFGATAKQWASCNQAGFLCSTEC